MMPHDIAPTRVRYAAPTASKWRWGAAGIVAGLLLTVASWALSDSPKPQAEQRPQRHADQHRAQPEQQRGADPIQPAAVLVSHAGLLFVLT